MAVTRQTVAQTFGDVLVWRPVFAPVFRTFEPILSAQETLTASLAEGLSACGLALPAVDADRIAQGVPLLAGATFQGCAPVAREAAATLLPILSGFDAVSAHLDSLVRFFDAPSDNGKAVSALFAAQTADDRASLQTLADSAGLDALMLGFAGGFVVSSVLHAMVALAPRAGDGLAAWEQPGQSWRHGHCPVCGALPGIAWLDRVVIDEKNPFLAGGGGKKHLHCNVCGADWAFRRNACPACGEEGNKNMEILKESGFSHGERIEWCNKCRGYCPCVDLRERSAIPNLDALAVGMMHMDMVAAEKRLHPLRATFWNLF